MIVVSNNVVISGSRDANGDLPVIEGGDWPFLVDATGAHTLDGAVNLDAIRVVGSGPYLIAHNTIDCGWMDGTAYRHQCNWPATAYGAGDERDHS